jgi:predicted alpha/beta-fold hydrolase
MTDDRCAAHPSRPLPFACAQGRSDSNTFIPAWWLPGPHGQTIWGPLLRSRRSVALRREVLRTADDDDLVLDHLEGSPGLRFVLLHGLEGSSYSVHIQGLLRIIARHRFAATVINFRSCARDPNRLSKIVMNRRPRLYHSGETGDLDFVIQTLAMREPQTPLVAMGVSLGGNALLKWLGEHPAQRSVIAAATESVPYDLGAGARYLERGTGRVYVARFFRTMREKTRSVVERFPELRPVIDLQRAMRARTFLEFDNASTAPLHSFRDADDYYTRSSSLQFLPAISIPTLCVSAEDDPFLPPEALQRARAAASPSIDFRITPNGGHSGFVCGPAPWSATYWAEELMVRWVIERAQR